MTGDEEKQPEQAPEPVQPAEEARLKDRRQPYPGEAARKRGEGA